MADTIDIDLTPDDWTALPDVDFFTAQNKSRTEIMRFAHATSKPADDFQGYDLTPKSTVSRLAVGIPWVYTQQKNSQIAFTEDDT